jgi:hypothetical protein
MAENAHPPVPVVPPEPITVVITYDPLNGNLNLQGPLNNRVLIYGILVSAMEAVLRQSLQGGSEGGRILIPKMGIRGA